MASARGAVLLAALVALFANVCHAAPTVDYLNDIATWSLDNHLGNNNVSLANVSIPATTLDVLMDAGLITDPTYRCVSFGGRHLRGVASGARLRRCRSLPGFAGRGARALEGRTVWGRTALRAGPGRAA